MAPSNAKREQTLELLRGPTLEVTIISPSSTTTTWGLPKALLSHHSGYFQRASRPDTFRESEESKITLPDFEPSTFKLFIEFMYYGRYSYRDDLSDKSRVRDSAKAWVLGDYLDAVEFKNFAISKLYDIYHPPNYARPKASVGPNAIDYVCSNATYESALCKLYEGVAIKYWHDPEVIFYESANQAEWAVVWDKHAELRNSLLYFLKQPQQGRAAFVAPLEDFLEKVVVSEEPSVVHE